MSLFHHFEYFRFSGCLGQHQRGSTKLSATTAQERHRALCLQVYGRYTNPYGRYTNPGNTGKSHLHSLCRIARNLGAEVVVTSQLLDRTYGQSSQGQFSAFSAVLPSAFSDLSAFSCGRLPQTPMFVMWKEKISAFSVFAWSGVNCKMRKIRPTGLLGVSRWAPFVSFTNPELSTIEVSYPKNPSVLKIVRHPNP